MLTILMVVSSLIHGSYYIGSKAENEWEGGWKDNWRGRDVCVKWYETMGNYSGVVQKSITTLRSPAKSRYETDGDQHSTYGLDGMDIFLHCGHSGTYYFSGTGVHNAKWEMYENGTRAFSSYMRLGDEARQLKLFSTYGCGQLNNNNGLRWQRWRPIFRGGLKYATGFHELAWLFGTDHAKNRQLGIDYANYLNSFSRTKKIKYAWWDAVKEHPDNTPAILVTGNLSGEASYRRDNATMGNILNYPVYRDGMVNYYAWSEWR
jgi:hypothetical protein